MSHILWESILLYYGNLFLENEGIFSQLVGNTFPQYMGQMKDATEVNEDCIVSLIHYRSRYTMRNESNKYEKLDKIRAFLRRNYEKYCFKNHFS